jgi:hypothetical protein
MKVDEARLDALREKASQGERASGGTVPLEGTPFPTLETQTGYYGNPLLKPPVWTWQVPLYFFAGGVAGASASIGFASNVLGHDAAIAHAGWWVALLGAIVSAPLLIWDLGRPSRFLNMLRVFKIQSPMSVGAWTLAVFSSAAGLSVLCQEILLRGFTGGLLVAILWAAEFVAMASGLVLLSYTSVLLGVTAIPAWAENRLLLPVHFVASALGASAAFLEITGFFSQATNRMFLVACVVETAVALSIELRRRPVDVPLREGNSGWALRLAGILAGPLPLLLAVFLADSPDARLLAAASFVLGALTSRYAWIAAGRASSRDARVLFALQRAHRTNRSSVR